jgi:hypothetical protein
MFSENLFVNNLNRHYQVNLSVNAFRRKPQDRKRDRRIPPSCVSAPLAALRVSPAPGTATFPNDVPTSHPYFRFIEALAAAGITGGCGPGSYCPNSPITRGEMAVFLAAALGLHWP